MFFKEQLKISGVFTVFLLVFFLPYLSQAALTTLDQQIKSISLNEQMEVLRDPTGKLTIDDMTRPEVAGLFKPVHGRFKAGYTKDVVWARFTLQKKDV